MFDPEVLEPDEVGFFEEVINVVRPVVEETVQAGKDAATSRGATLADELIRSSAFANVLTQVEASAKKAVTEEVKKNALALGGIAVSAGIVGGTFFKGKTGLIVAAVLAAGGIYVIASGGSAPPKRR